MNLDPISGDVSNGGDGTDLTDRIVRAGLLAPQLPKDFSVVLTGNGVRLVITDNDHYVGRSGTTDYVFAWSSNVDVSTQTGRDAGAASAEQCAQVAAPGKLDQQATFFLSDNKYQSGTFFCWGVDYSGKRTDSYLWSQLSSGEILDSTVPGDVTHAQVSGAGEYIGSDVFEAISVACVAPNPLTSFDGVQLWLKDYINLGSMQEGEFHRYLSSVAGGSMQFKVPYSVAKRIGAGTITLTNGSPDVTGSGFLTQAQNGDVVFCGGSTATVQTVNSDASITLLANWGGKSVTGFTDYAFFAKVTIYLVSISKAGTHRSDVTNAPSAALVFDGSLGTPNAPSNPLATTMGNVIRIEFQQVIGTKIKGYKLWRATGAGQAFSACSVIDFVPQPKETISSFSSLIQFIDSSFTTYQREQGQVYTYYVTTINEAATNNESSAAHALNSNGLDPSCRLDSPADASPVIPAGSNPRNLLFDSYIYGTAGNTVSPADASQDTYSGAAPTGYNRWDTAVTGGATPAGHQNDTEVVLPAPGAGKSVTLKQMTGAWDNGTAAKKRVDKGRTLMFAIFMESSSPTPPNGSITLDILMLDNANGTIGQYAVKNRLSDDSLDYSQNSFVVAGSLITQGPQCYYAVFSAQTIPAGVWNIQARITHSDTNNGNNLYVTKAMLCYGDQLAAWTPELVNAAYPGPTGGHIPGDWFDRDGSRRGRIPVP